MPQSLLQEKNGPRLQPHPQPRQQRRLLHPRPSALTTKRRSVKNGEALPILPCLAMHSLLLTVIRGFPCAVCCHRLFRNRLSAHQHREKQRVYRQDLEDYNRTLQTEFHTLRYVSWSRLSIALDGSFT
jgi:hypothetical protein